MLGLKNSGLSGVPSGMRANENFIEQNADRFGNQSELAARLNNVGLENLVLQDDATKGNYGENYYPSVVLDVDDTRFGIENGESEHKISFDLADMVLSTSSKKIK